MTYNMDAFLAIKKGPTPKGVGPFLMEKMKSCVEQLIGFDNKLNFS